PSWIIPAESITNWVLAPVAHGGFGEVYRASYNGIDVAVKQPFRGQNNRLLDDFRKEIAIWSKLSHPHVLPFIGACDNNSKHCVVSPFMPNGTLHAYISNPSSVRPLNEKLCLLYQVASGMAYLHANNIAHGDLKPINVLMDKSFSAVIADFGLACIRADSDRSDNREGSISGTPGFMAPELLGGPHQTLITKRSDVFAFAIAAVEVIKDGRPAWTRNGNRLDNGSITRHVLRGDRPARISGVSDDVWQLISECWAQAPDGRPKFPAIVEAL
ncbi:kinase-like domain-containing protein, partial [Polychytrium aggregatum]|uniref:kinase-like domain-containing protein n=1 Tax=Polychytrium aggregatum TaxID=110093 RepID=UPI0022FE845D